MKKSLYNNYRQFFFQRGAVKEPFYAPATKAEKAILGGASRCAQNAPRQTPAHILYNGNPAYNTGFPFKNPAPVVPVYNAAGRPPVMYWKPTIGSGGAQLNDYQYIKCKWLFELLTGRGAVLHKDYGFLIQPIPGGPKAPPKGLAAAPSLLPSYWPHELLGNRYRLFNTVLISGRGGKVL
jgi:hypothetical protein